MSVPQQPAVGLVVGRRYELTAHLGRGGFSTVWQAHDATLQRDVAVKLITVASDERESIVTRFWREAQAVAKLNHPNIVTAHDFGVFEDSAYLVMELITGGSLADELATRRMSGTPPFDIRRVTSIGMQVAAGLGAAHASGLVHRDLKPANIMLVRPAGTLKIVDFGIAHISELTRLTKPGGYLGTLPYASPEQMSAGTVDGRSDLYSLGCLLYELLTDHSPFAAESPAQWIAAHQAATPTPIRTYLPAVPAELESLVHALLAKDPSRRPANADDVRTRLARIAIAPSAPPAPRPTLIDSQVVSPQASPHPAMAKPVNGVAPQLSPRPASVPPGYAPPRQAQRAPQPAAPYYAWQPVSTPQGWVVMPQLVMPPTPRPVTTSVAGRLLIFLSAACAFEAAVVAAAIIPVGRAEQDAFQSLDTSAGSAVVVTMMFIAIGFGVSSFIAGLIGGATLRGSRAARIWTWILGLPSLLITLSAIGGTDSATSAATPQGADRLRPAVVRAMTQVREAVPPWYIHLSTAFDVVASMILLAALVLIVLPASSTYIRVHSGLRTVRR